MWVERLITFGPERVVVIASTSLLGLCVACGPASDRVTPALIQLTPERSESTDRLTVVISEPALAPNGAAIESYRYRWSRDGEEMKDQITDSVSSLRTMKGERWEVSVSPSDYPSVTSKASVVVGNGKPAVSLSLDSIAPSTLDDITVEAVTSDPDGDDISLAFEWSVDGVSASIIGPTVHSESTAAGERWQVQVTATDAEGASTVALEEVVVENTPPAVLSVSIEPCHGYTSDRLSGVVEVYDPDEDAVLLNNEWRVNGQTLKVGEDSFLDESAFAKGDFIDLLVTAADSVASGETVRSSVCVIQNSPPQILGVRLSPEAPTSSDTILAVSDGESDDDGDDVTLRVTWYVNGQDRSLATDELSNTWFERGDEVYASIAGFDGDEEGPAAVSASVVIANSLPTAPIVIVSPGKPQSGDSLNCSVDREAFDQDGDSLVYSYSWQVDGRDSGERSAEIEPDIIVSGQEWTCMVAANDGFSIGASGSDSVTVE